MAKSREDFLRAMGITAEDTVDPSQKATKFVTAFTSGRGAPQESNRDSSAQSKKNASFGAGAAHACSTATRGAAPRASHRDTDENSEPDAYTTTTQTRYVSAEPPTPPPRQQRGSCMEIESPVAGPVPTGKKTDTALSAREQFLASLQIDNMDDPADIALRGSPNYASSNANDSHRKAASGASQVRNTASQEIYKDTAAVASALGSAKENVMMMPSPKGSSKKQLVRSNVSFSEEDDCMHGQQQQAAAFRPTLKQDSIIGMRKTSKNAPNAAPPSLPDPHDGLSADEQKALGNKYFEDGEFRKAVRMYSKAIDQDPSNAALYSNRSAAYLQAAKQMGIDTRMMALRDADKVIELRPSWFKGFSRRGDALFKLDRPSEAAEAYQRGLELDEGNVNLMHSLGEAKAAAGGTKPTYASAWATAPTRKQHDASAHDLVEDLRRTMQQANPDAKMGHDYREEALEQFRSRKTTSSLSSFCGEPATRTSGAAQSNPPVASTKKLDRSQISEEFSSAAAHNYQQGLLEAYRKKKLQSGC